MNLEQFHSASPQPEQSSDTHPNTLSSPVISFPFTLPYILIQILAEAWVTRHFHWSGNTDQLSFMSDYAPSPDLGWLTFSFSHGCPLLQRLKSIIMNLDSTHHNDTILSYRCLMQTKLLRITPGRPQFIKLWSIELLLKFVRSSLFILIKAKLNLKTTQSPGN